MFAALLVTFRETLEASLIVGIILAHLKKMEQSQYARFVWAGVAAGLGVSIVAAILFQTFLGGFTGTTEALVEGVLMLVGALLLTTMIFWMMKRRHMVAKLKAKVEQSISKAQRWELFSLVFVAVLREGIETVIFISALYVAAGNASLVGGVIGIPIAAILGYLLYKRSLKMNLKSFFTFTSILLILFAAGLVSHGIHELQEAQALPTMVEHVWDVNPAVSIEGSYPLLHEKGAIGSIGKGLFGYNGNPSFLEVTSYLLYLLIIGLIWRNIGRKKQT